MNYEQVESALLATGMSYRERLELLGAIREYGSWRFYAGQAQASNMLRSVREGTFDPETHVDPRPW